jgi:hypothetical protein
VQQICRDNIRSAKASATSPRPPQLRQAAIGSQSPQHYRLFKITHFIICPNIEIPIVARLFLKHVWKHHGLSDSIIFDRETQFVSAFWNELTRQLKIDARLFSTYHFKTDE